MLISPTAVQAEENKCKQCAVHIPEGRVRAQRCLCPDDFMQDSAVLVQQLADLQSQCQSFASEAEALRVQVATLEGARDGAEAALASAQQELAHLKEALQYVQM